MNIRLVIYMSLIVPALSWGYNLGKIDITNYEFRRYIIPQLRSILSDFTNVAKHYAETQTPLFKSKNKFTILKRNYLKVLKACPKYLGEECKQSLTEMLNTSRSIEKLVLEETLLVDPKKQLFIDQVRSINKMATATGKLTIHIENVLTSIGMGKELDNNMTDQLKNVLTQTTLYYHHYLVSLMPEKYYNNFKVLWTQFILPIEEKIILDSNVDFIRYNLTQLNSTWHDFNMFFLKKEKSTPKKIETYLNTMNRRWNSILKLSLVQGR